MTAPRAPEIVKRFECLPEEIKWYYLHIPQLIKQYPWDVSISYAFSLLETAHNMTVYCGIVKLHKVNSEMAWSALESHHMTRAGFRELYKTIFGSPLPRQVVDKIRGAEITRDKILHGKGASESDKRQAMMDVLDYAELYNAELDQVAGFKPFGPLKGFKGRAKSLDKSTSRWILKGIGLIG